MFQHLPSTQQLRAFEASVRYFSFTHAADELNLTQSAVSHQINSLEELIGQKLFLRRNRKLLLTPAGKKLLDTVQKVLPQLQHTITALREERQHNKITISTLPSIAATWLVQKLTGLRSTFPDLDLSVLASEKPDNFSTDVPIDLAINFTHPEHESGKIRLMMDEFYLPVCAPSLLRDPALPLLSPQDLQHHTLIFQNDTLGWKGWFTHHQLHHITPKHFLSFNHDDLAIQAAIEGQGVALARSLMVERALEQKLLISPFDMPLPTRRKYYIITPHDNANNSMVNRVADWLCQQALQDKMTKS